MHPVEVSRIEVAFHVLEPVRLLHHDARVGDVVGRERVRLELGERWRRLARTHVDPHHVVDVATSVSRGFDLVLEVLAEAAAVLLGRQVHAVAVHIELASSPYGQGAVIREVSRGREVRAARESEHARGSVGREARQGVVRGLIDDRSGAR